MKATISVDREIEFEGTFCSNECGQHEALSPGKCRVFGYLDLYYCDKKFRYVRTRGCLEETTKLWEKECVTLLQSDHPVYEEIYSFDEQNEIHQAAISHFEGLLGSKNEEFREPKEAEYIKAALNSQKYLRQQLLTYNQLVYQWGWFRKLIAGWLGVLPKQLGLSSAVTKIGSK